MEQVAECVADPHYEGLTFGVVTMMSGPQAQIIESMLVKRLGPEEYERRRLRVGNPPVFQGDERNIVFISVVADDNSYAATSAMHEQWANVAASRAQDQLWVFYTVDPSTLNPQDQRRQLIEYVCDSRVRATHDDLFDLTESKFERDVLAQMLDRGYSVEPQHRVGSYRIDFVVTVAEGERLAVECDGDSFHGPDKWDEDVRRQRVLERLGWTFWRVRASAYYLDPNMAMQPLWDRLEEMKRRATESEERRRAKDEKLAAERLARLEREAEEAARAASSITRHDDEPDPTPASVESPARDEPIAATDMEASPHPSGRDPACESGSTFDAVPPAVIRRWARANNIAVGKRGRLAPELKRAYDAAHGEGREARETPSSPATPSIARRTPPLVSTKESTPSPADVDEAWRSGQRYQLDYQGKVRPRGGGIDLESAVGESSARAVLEAMKRARPHGGAFKIDSSGILVTCRDNVPVFVMRVAPENWFPGHLR
ncbi:DUF559 domain-containing protein [Georgenia deserti]|uniref:DUF559 domain-containing protein n=1 Tax=Georgenia deserti TaxID=2093781 RepID=A0ABW4L5M7_9MICO